MGEHVCSEWHYREARRGYMLCTECGTERPKPEAVHQFFGLTYANYLVLHRTALQSMSDEWQAQFVNLLEELHETLAWPEGALEQQYAVQVRTSGGRFGRDVVPHYNRGRSRLQKVARDV